MQRAAKPVEPPPVAAAVPAAAAFKEASVVAVDVEHIVVSALALAEGAVAFVVFLFTFSSALAFLFGFGVAAIVLRQFFFFLLPLLIRRADVVVGVLNLMINALIAFSDGVILTIDAGIAIGDAFGSSTKPIPPWKFDVVSVSDYKAAMQGIANECQDYTSIPTMWERTFLPPVSDAVCPYVRAAYPVFGRVLDALPLRGWLSADPDPYANNCAIEPASPYAPTCVALGSGYIIVEVLLPFLLLCVFIMCDGKALQHVVWHTSTLIIYLATHIVEFAFGAGRWLERKLAGRDEE